MRGVIQCARLWLCWCGSVVVVMSVRGCGCGYVCLGLWLCRFMTGGYINGNVDCTVAELNKALAYALLTNLTMKKIICYQEQHNIPC